MTSSSFVGRRNELTALEHHLATAQSQNASVVLVEGSAGMGKSALVDAFSGRLDGALHLAVTGDEDETELPFGLYRQLVGGSTSPQHDPFAAGADILRVLGDPPDDASVVLTVDDAHLADLASLRAITFALRRLRKDRVMALITARTEGLGRLPSGLVRLIEEHNGRMSLSGLTDREIVELGTAMGRGQMSQRVAARLREHTGGSPLHLRALLAEFTIDQLDGLRGPLPAPRSYALLVLRHLAALSTTAQRIVGAAAVLGDGASLDVIATAAEVSEASPALEELEQANVLRLQASRDGWHVHFEHPLVRTAVYDDLGPATRARLHTLAAKALGPPDALAHLLAAASRPDDALAAEAERHALIQKNAGSLSRAADAMFAAARLSESAPVADRRLLDAVELLSLSADARSALAYAERIAAMPVDAHRLSVQARLAWLAGRLEEAERLGADAWSEPGALDPLARDALAAMLAQLFILRDEGETAAEWAADALASGRLPADQTGATQAAAAIGLAISGRVTEGLGLLATLPSDPAVVRLERHQELRARGILRMIADQLTAARDDLVVCASFVHRELSPSALAAMAALADTEYRLGDWDGSLAHAEQCVSLVQDTEQLWLQAFVHCAAVLVLAGRGQWELAQGHLDAARHGAAVLGDPASAACVDNAAVHLAMCRGNPSQVVEHAARLADTPHGAPHEPGLLGWPVHYVSALVDLGRLDEAAAELAALEAVARQRQRASRRAALARVRGELGMARRDRKQARDAFEEAVSLASDGADALERVTVHAAYGKFLRRRGERRSAADQLRLARDGFVQLGAIPFLQSCDAELVACGSSPGPRDTYPETTLTPQERVVTRLICSGKSNQEVADELVLSVKTVGYHLGNVYTKLGVHSRTQLITQLANAAR